MHRKCSERKLFPKCYGFLKRKRSECIVSTFLPSTSVSSTPNEVSAIPCELFGNTLRALFLKNRDFFCYGETFLPNTQGPLGCLLGFWPSGPDPCGRNNFGEFQHEYNLNLNILSFLHINEKYPSLLSVSIPSHHSSVSLLNNQRENLVLLET